MLAFRKTWFFVAGVTCLLNSRGMAGAIDALKPSSIERQALISLFNATDGHNWKRKDNWLGGVGSECQWYGVSCGIVRDQDQHGRISVKSVRLVSNGLKGSVPDDLALLKSVQAIDLSGNEVNGLLPSELRERFDHEYLVVRPAQLVTAIRQFYMRRWNPSVACSGSEATLSIDGKVKQVRRISADTGEGCTCLGREGAASVESILRVARDLETGGFLSGTYRRGPGEYSDVTKVEIGARSGPVDEKFVFSSADASTDEWRVRTLTDGVLSSVSWREEAREQCGGEWAF